MSATATGFENLLYSVEGGIATIARGVARKVRPGSRYFPYYTRPWIADEDFDINSDP